MTHQDRIAANNAFWREMLDQIPATVLIFRIDKEEQAQLFFVNAHIKNDLGFNAEEYVLGSESTGQIADELNLLVNEIARLSHHEKISNPAENQITLSTRDEEQVEFNYDYRIFQSKTSRINLISVTLFKMQESSSAAIIKPTFSGKLPKLQPVFVSDSPIMCAVVDKIDNATHQDSHVLVHGEPHTGKRTLIQRMLNTLRMTGASFKLLEADLETSKPEEALPILFKGPIDAQVHALSESRDDIILVLSEIGNLTLKHLERIVALLDYRGRIGLKTRVFMTSAHSMDFLNDKGKVPEDLVYRYTFMSVPVPPLRHRKMDIPVIAKKWSAKACAVLDIKPVEFTEAQLFQLEEQPWPDNLKGLYETLRFAVLGSQNGRPDIRHSKTENGPTPEKKKAPAPDFTDVVSFDEMNKKYLQHVLKLTNGKIYGEDGAAAMLKLKPTTLQSKLKKLKIR